MPEIDEKMLQDVNEAVTTLREKADKFDQKSVDFQSAIDKTADILDKQEKANEELVKQIKTAEKEAIETKERMDELELALAKAEKSNPHTDYKQLPEYKALNKFFAKGLGDFTPEEKALLRTDDNVNGGYLVTPEFDNMILKDITEISNMRAIAKVRTVNKKTLEMPTRTSLIEASYEGEAEQAAESVSQYGSESMTAYRLSVVVTATMDMLMDADVDLENEVNSDVAEAFAFKEGNKFVLGTGVKQPEGFVQNTDIIAGARETAGSGVISGDDILLLTGDLKVGYNPMFTFNRQTLAYIRTLKGSTNDHYLWQVGIGGSQPNTLAGEPYMVMQDMPTIAAGNLAIAYGDFARGYEIIDRRGMSMVRDDVTLASKAIVKFTFHRWNTGQVVKSEAIKALKIKA